MSMYVSARPVRRRPATSRGSRGNMLLNSSGSKTSRRALQAPRFLGRVSPQRVLGALSPPRFLDNISPKKLGAISPTRRAQSPKQDPKTAAAASSTSEGACVVQDDLALRIVQQPAEGVPPGSGSAQALDHESDDALDAAHTERKAAAERKQAAAAAAEESNKTAEAKRKREAAAKRKAAKQKAASAAKAKAAAKAQTEPHPQGAITEHEFRQARATLLGFQTGKIERTHPNGTPLKIIMENKRHTVHAVEVDGLLTTLTECQFNTSAEKMFKALTDFEYQKSYDDYIKHKSAIDHLDGNEVVFHELKLPTPLTNRDYVYYRKIQADRKTDTFQWMQRDLPNWGKGRQPEVKGVIRAGRGDFWLQSIIQGTGKDTCTMVMYQTDNFAGDIPKWVMNKATKVALPAFLKDVEIAGQQLYVDEGTKTEKEFKQWKKAYSSTV